MCYVLPTSCSGRLGLRTGVVKNFEEGSLYGLPQTEITLAEALRDAGYSTAMVRTRLEHSGCCRLCGSYVVKARLRVHPVQVCGVLPLRSCSRSVVEFRSANGTLVRLKATTRRTVVSSGTSVCLTRCVFSPITLSPSSLLSPPPHSLRRDQTARCFGSALVGTTDLCTWTCRWIWAARTVWALTTLPSTPAAVMPRANVGHLGRNMHGFVADSATCQV